MLSGGLDLPDPGRDLCHLQTDRVGQLVAYLGSLLVCRGDHVGVDVRRRADLRVPEPAGDNDERGPLSDHHARIGVTQAVDMNGRQAGPLHEVSKPLSQRVREDRSPVVPGEDPAVLVLPVVPAEGPLSVLPLLVLEEHEDRGAGDLQRPGARLVLRRIGVDAVAGSIGGSLNDRDRLGVEVYVLPAKPEELAAAEAAQQIEGDHRPVLYRLTLQQLEELPGLHCIEVESLLLLHLRKLGVCGGIVGQVPPFHSLPQRGAYDPVIAADRARGKNALLTFHLEGCGELQAEGSADRFRRLPVHVLAPHGDPESVQTDPGLAGEGRQSPAVLCDQRPQLYHAAGFFVAPKPFLFEVCIETVEVAGPEILQSDMTDRLIDPAEPDLVVGVRLDLQLLLAEVPHPDLGELLKTDARVMRSAGADLLLEEDLLALELLRLLPCGHAGGRSPRHVFADLLPVDVIACGGRDLVAVAALYCCCHRFPSFSSDCVPI